jgi:hypothetical protein
MRRTWRTVSRYTEGRPQCYGTQRWQDPAHGRFRPWTLADADRVNDLRGEVGLGLMQPTPEMGSALSPKEREEIERDNRWWQEVVHQQRMGWVECSHIPRTGPPQVAFAAVNVPSDRAAGISELAERGKGVWGR